MKLQKRGKTISKVEVLNISAHGIWLSTNKKEYFLSYKQYPWFEDAKVKDICNVELLDGYHLYWPDLDIDLEIDSLENPEKYPLTFHKK